MGCAARFDAVLPPLFISGTITLEEFEVVFVAFMAF
jgi:hypothetical protein